MPPRPTSTRISYCPKVARRSAACCASAASGRTSMLAPVGVASVGPDQGRETGMPVPQRGQNDAPGLRLAPQRRQEDGGLGVIPTAEDTAIRGPALDAEPYCLRQGSLRGENGGPRKEGAGLADQERMHGDVEQYPDRVSRALVGGRERDDDVVHDSVEQHAVPR